MNRAHRIAAVIAAGVAAVPAFAQEAPAPAAAAAPAAAPAPPALGPSLGGALVGNSSPMNVEINGFGKVYVTGVVSGLGRVQNSVVPGDKGSFADVSNAQVFVQKVDGVLQFYGQFGLYSIPSLGTPYVRASRLNEATFGPVLQAFIKIAPTAAFSVEVGKLPTLIGAEYTFTFQNMNIDRGLLWNQEQAVSKGVQANYTHGPLAFALSLNDGFYSSKYNTVSGSVTYTVNPANVLTFAASGNTKVSYKSTLATPVLQNNEQIYYLSYAYTKGAWVLNPYVQYTHVDALPLIGTTSASTVGGALLAKYTFSPSFSLPVRLEYISSSGRRGSSAASLLYGPGSDAFSITATPTYQYKIFFLRAEASYVSAGTTTAGAAFGPRGNDQSQARGLLEFGVMF